MRRKCQSERILPCCLIQPRGSKGADKQEDVSECKIECVSAGGKTHHLFRSVQAVDGW